MTLALLLLQFFTTAQAASLRDACREFSFGEGAAMRKCMSHSESFELNGEFVSAVNSYSRDPEVRMKVLKSGANLETLKICRATGWSLDNQISCMRPYPTEEIMKACRKISGDEEEQLRCVRIGREPNQILGCAKFSRNIDHRFSCMEEDLPVVDARICAKKNKTEAGRMKCLQEFVAKRDGTWEPTGRALASEPAKSK